MNAPSSILDADMGTVARQLRAGFAWWRQELAALVPARWRTAGRARPAVVAHYSQTGSFRLFRRGLPLAQQAPGKGITPVAIALPAEMCLVRKLVYPMIGESDLRRMVELDADRLLPFAAGAAFVDVELAERDLAAGRQHVMLAALPRQRAAMVIEAAAEAGLEPRAVGIGAGDAAGALRFDFLPGIRADGAGLPGFAAARVWWSALAILFALNLAMLIGRDMRSVASLRALVAEQAQAAGVARQIGQRILREDQRRALLVARRAARDPLAVLALATAALPDGAWVQCFAWNGATLRLTGYKNGDVDILAALRRQPAFADVRASSSDIPARQDQGQPFDVTLDLVRNDRR